MRQPVLGVLCVFAVKRIRLPGLRGCIERVQIKRRTQIAGVLRSEPVELDTRGIGDARDGVEMCGDRRCIDGGLRVDGLCDCFARDSCGLGIHPEDRFREREQRPVKRHGTSAIVAHNDTHIGVRVVDTRTEHHGVIRRSVKALIECR